MILGLIDHILAGHSCAFAKSFQLGAQRVDRSIPLALVAGVAVRAEALQFRQFRRAQHVQIQVILTRDFIDKLALENEAALGSQIGVIIEALLQTRRQRLEIRLAGVVAGQDGRWQFVERSGGQQESLLSGRIVQGHAVRRGSRVGDRLLVNHLGTGCAADLW